jgi:hypothetical protein
VQPSGNGGPSFGEPQHELRERIDPEIEVKDGDAITVGYSNGLTCTTTALPFLVSNR